MSRLSRSRRRRAQWRDRPSLAVPLLLGLGGLALGSWLKLGSKSDELTRRTAARLERRA